MEVIKEGVHFRLTNYLDKTKCQELKFIEKDETGKILDGITTEEVLYTLISRMKTLNNKRYNFYNTEFINYCKNALEALKRRKNDQADKKERRGYYRTDSNRDIREVYSTDSGFKNTE
jgi:hypothetical protein